MMMMMINTTMECDHRVLLTRQPAAHPQDLTCSSTAGPDTANDITVVPEDSAASATSQDSHYIKPSRKPTAQAYSSTRKLKIANPAAPSKQLLVAAVATA
jgi:hypothetical protein